MSSILKRISQGKLRTDRARGISTRHNKGEHRLSIAERMCNRFNRDTGKFYYSGTKSNRYSLLERATFFVPGPNASRQVKRAFARSQA